jgi:hypothetical protein
MKLREDGNYLLIFRYWGGKGQRRAAIAVVDSNGEILEFGVAVKPATADRGH